VQFLSRTKISDVIKALIRADLDVPLSSDGAPAELYRLEALIPTLSYLIEKDIFPIIAGHVGRPGGTPDPKLSTKHLTSFFDKALGKGSYALLENLRFNPGEKSKDSGFAQELASRADIFINDSFATAHRDAASTTLLPKLLPSYVGLRLEQEIEVLNKVIKSDEAPKIAVVGGVKESKKEAIYALADVFDLVLVVGKFSKKSSDPEKENVVYPLDYSAKGLDIGPETSEVYAKHLFGAKLVVWAGPAGAYNKGYFEGSRQIAKAIEASKAYSVVGGGDTITCLNQLGFLDEFDFVSTGGGALLDFLSGKTLPALEALDYYA
jgi:phosphoglycerate kinase